MGISNPPPLAAPDTNYVGGRAIYQMKAQLFVLMNLMAIWFFSENSGSYEILRLNEGPLFSEIFFYDFSNACHRMHMHVKTLAVV